MNAPARNETREQLKSAFPCPFVYASGKPCVGSIVRVVAYKADVVWNIDAAGQATMTAVSEPHLHYHLSCSLKDSHGGAEALKLHWNEFPKLLRRMIRGAKLALL
jgi:hypothetical protein